MRGASEALFAVTGWGSGGNGKNREEFKPQVYKMGKKGQVFFHFFSGASEIGTGGLIDGCVWLGRCLIQGHPFF